MTLNKEIYARFWLDFEINEIQKGFKSFIKNLFWERKGLLVILKPDIYKNASDLYNIQWIIKKESCRQLFMDYSKFDSHNFWFEWLIAKITEENDFNRYIIKLQILLNVIYNQKLINFDYNNFIAFIKQYLEDFPQLWLNIKVYKTKSAEFFPALNSKILNTNIDNVLWILEKTKYENTLKSFEEGLKMLLFSKTEWDYKNVIEDMLATCDEFVKEFLWDKNKWFKHIFKDWEFEKFWLNKQNKEIYRTLRDYMDSIKHWTLKDFTREDIEMSVNLTATFINFVLNKVK